MSDVKMLFTPHVGQRRTRLDVDKRSELNRRPCLTASHHPCQFYMHFYWTACLLLYLLIGGTQIIQAYNLSSAITRKLGPSLLSPSLICIFHNLTFQIPLKGYIDKLKAKLLI